MADIEEGETAASQAVNAAVDERVIDIFGDEDSDDDIILKKSGGGDESDIADSDDDGQKKLNPYKSIGKSTSSSSPKAKKEKKAKKRKGGDDDEANGKKKKKKRKGEKESRPKRVAPKSSSAPREPREDNGNAYDSGDEAVADADDERFLADEDDALLAGVVGEYGADEQNFNDEAPLEGVAKKKSRAGVSDVSRPKKPVGFFDGVLKDMRAKKKAIMGDADKQKAATELLKLMDHAHKEDVLAFSKSQPAVNKINLLPRVEAVVAVKALQGTLLDFDILGVFADWICVKKDKSLPSHTVRTSVYKMLNDLPCQSDHLKRRNEGAAHTIGMVIMSLYKHKEETKENKRFLKTIIEKWSRPIYNKTSDVRSANLVGNVELQQAQYLHIDQHVRERELADAASQVADVGALMTKKAKNKSTEAFGANRAITPYSAGFMFQSRPEAKSVVNRSTMSANDETRKGLLKKMNDMKGVKGWGKKESNKTMDMESTGRNKLNIG